MYRFAAVPSDLNPGIRSGPVVPWHSVLWYSAAMTTYQQKITFGELRETGVRHVLVYCRDHKCSHHIEVSADRWPALLSKSGPSLRTDQDQ